MKGKCNMDDNVSLKNNGANIAAFLYYLKEKHPKHFTRIEKAVASVSPFLRILFNAQPLERTADPAGVEAEGNC